MSNPLEPSPARPVRRAERPVTVKIDSSEIDILQALALVAETTLAQQIRVAIEQYLEWRLNRPDLTDQIAGAQARQASRLNQLLDPEGEIPPAPASESAPSHGRQRSITLRIPNRECDLMIALGLLDETTLADQLRSSVARFVEQQLRDRALGEQVKGVQADREKLLTAS